MSEESRNVFCRFEFGEYEQELTIPLTSFTESQIRGATDLFLKLLRNNLLVETEERET
ncbi:hypothetical protein ES705_09358 [subsurface metagenome]